MWKSARAGGAGGSFPRAVTMTSAVAGASASASRLAYAPGAAASSPKGTSRMASGPRLRPDPGLTMLRAIRPAGLRRKPAGEPRIGGGAAQGQQGAARSRCPGRCSAASMTRRGGADAVVARRGLCTVPGPLVRAKGRGARSLPDPLRGKRPLARPDDEGPSRSRSPFRLVDAHLEPADEAVHPREAQQDHIINPCTPCAGEAVTSSARSPPPGGRIVRRHRATCRACSWARPPGARCPS